MGGSFIGRSMLHGRRGPAVDIDLRGKMGKGGLDAQLVYFLSIEAFDILVVGVDIVLYTGL